MEQSVTLVSATRPEIRDPEDKTGSYIPMSLGEYIAFCARVSNPANQANVLTAPKLLKYLVEHHHWSPFEMAHVTLEINTTRDIGRQILRHRSFSFQEFSQRYAAVSTADFVIREARLQDTKNRQNSIETKDDMLQRTWLMKQQQISHEAGLAYKWALENGIAKEQARVVLPEGLTPTRMYMSGSVRSWIHYCQLRTTQGTQKEHREIAQLCWKVITNEIEELDGII